MQVQVFQLSAQVAGKAVAFGVTAPLPVTDAMIESRLRLRFGSDLESWRRVPGSGRSAKPRKGGKGGGC